MKKIFWAGDSTVQFNDITTYPQTGIGQAMQLFVREDCQVRNFAKNGRSTKSFIDEGRLSAIEAEIEEGDILLIQFGHNDEKIKDPTRYTTPFGSFQDNLLRFVEVARKAGAYPVLITPIERRCFGEDGLLGPGDHGDYVEGMRQAAAKGQVPLIDLYDYSRDLLNKLGPKRAEALHLVVEPGRYPAFEEGKDDHTHLCYRGAVTYAAFVAGGLAGLGDPYMGFILEGDFKGPERDLLAGAPKKPTGMR